MKIVFRVMRKAVQFRPLCPALATFQNELLFWSHHVENHSYTPGHRCQIEDIYIDTCCYNSSTLFFLDK